MHFWFTFSHKKAQGGRKRGNINTLRILCLFAAKYLILL